MARANARRMRADVSPVSARVLAIVRGIPRGRVATYGQVAARAGLPRHARHVGYALHALPEGTPLPWHRVVGAGGAIRLRRADGAWTQRMRLEREGVTFTPRGRVRLDAFGWTASRGRERGLSPRAQRRLSPHVRRRHAPRPSR